MIRTPVCHAAAAVAIGLALLAGCAPGERTASRPRPAVPVEITYETGPCFGACPVYSVTVTNRGGGVFEGRRATAVTGRRTFVLSPAQFEAFDGVLRPTRGLDSAAYTQGGARCARFATDHSSVTVTRREGGAAPMVFTFSYGCRDAENATLAESLRRAPDALPIGELIGRR